ncbi:MAG: polyphenol oxidase family protein [Planctomycetota bacterium]|nr:polyphenol oxidase family protein [Planctomycetota bacterium]
MSGSVRPGVLRSERLAARAVPHAFTTRVGGVSAGVFASLNFGNPMDLAGEDRDPTSNIAENFRRVLVEVGAAGREVVQTYQVHGARAQVFRAGDPSRDAGTQGALDFKADALVTDDPARVLAVRVADCAPVLLASEDGRVVAAVHAGWRGVVAGVASEAVRAMHALGATSIIGAIGPCIGPDEFEVGPEVLAEFRRVFGPDAPVRERAGGKGDVDLKAALRTQLARAGVSELDVLPGCTAGEPARFFSHRRDKGVTGRMVGLVGPR